MKSLKRYFLINIKYEEAIISLDKALSLDENNVNALFARAACHNKLGNIQQSIDDYNLAIEKDSINFHSTSLKKIDKVLEMNNFETCPNSSLPSIIIVIEF